MLSWSCGSPLRMARWTSRSSTLNFYWQSKKKIYITYKRASVKNLGNHAVLEEKECNLSIKSEPKSRKATPYLLPLLTLQKARRNELDGCGNRHRMKTAQSISKMQRKKEEAEEKTRRMKKRSEVVVFKYRQENLGDSLYCRLPAEYHSLHRFPGWPPGQQWRHPDRWVKGTGSLVSLSWTTHAPWATENKYTSSQYMQKRTLTEMEYSSHCAWINQMSDLKIQKNTEEECSSHCARISQMSDLKIQKKKSHICC